MEKVMNSNALLVSNIPLTSCCNEWNSILEECFGRYSSDTPGNKIVFTIKSLYVILYCKEMHFSQLEYCNVYIHSSSNIFIHLLRLN